MDEDSGCELPVPLVLLALTIFLEKTSFLMNKPVFSLKKPAFPAFPAFLGEMPRPSRCRWSPVKGTNPEATPEVHFPVFFFWCPVSILQFLVSIFWLLVTNFQMWSIYHLMDLSWMLTPFGVDCSFVFHIFCFVFSWLICVCFSMDASKFVGSLLFRRTLADTYSTAWI